MRVVLVGAGVAGGVIARGLRGMSGIDLVMVERVAPRDHARAGNGLNIGPNALLALDRLLPEMAAELRAASLPWTRWRASLIDGTLLHDLPLAEVAHGPGVRIGWSELYRIVREPVADVTRYGQRCVDVVVERDGKARLTVARGADGALEEIGGIDLVIACDGRYSRVRERLCGAPAVRHLGVANFRLLIDDRGASGIDDLDQWYHGPNRLLAFRLVDGRIYLTGNFPIAPGSEIAESQKTAAFLRGAYLPSAGPTDAAGDFLIEATCRQLATLHWSRLQESGTRFHDASGHVLFVGDSAHAMAPSLGQGATQAIEDGCAFLGLFRQRHGDAGFTVAGLTAAYDGLRRARIEFVKQFSWDSSASLVMGSDPLATNRAKTTPLYRAQLRQLYGDLGFAATPHRAA
jgi:salicylate hydroxylase